ncbi:Na-translocating system protein MpsC family protein [Planococcus sp. N028]|uniref:Na-translocating system protein MpsC family protein n=1 Tax=Planococcus shixiaomingii TaxID=3058393 RepID=A0ABT8N4K8_9BACL|nr:Na-translocating system protein MpsC family protein [Planococcus sp. N028]MDN7242678.1 Na-translocating system protein MpsC family protein [Planococcus sp. N028]
MKLQKEVGSYISSLMRTYFGKGPTSVHVTINRPFITIHFRGFITPMEKFLLKQNEERRVLETRDMLMDNMKAEVVQELKEIGKLELKEIYSDWNLDKKTGVVIGVIDEEVDRQTFEWPDDLSEKNFQEQLIKANILSEKAPDEQETYWLDNRTILVRRAKFLLPIEKELIKNGHIEELKRAKWQLEQKVLSEMEFEPFLKRTIAETFLDWDFEEDLGYIVFILKPGYAYVEDIEYQQEEQNS